MANECDQLISNESSNGSEKGKMLKPEKVKSRWRRNSEMENGEKCAYLQKFHESLEATDISEKNCHEKASVSNENAKNIFSLFETTVEETVPPENIPPVFTEIAENFYLFEKKRNKSKKEVRRMLCDCTLSKEECENGVLGCEDECLNRLLMIECGSRCANGQYCSNKRFQRRQYVKAEPFKTQKKGWGLQLLEDVLMGTFVVEYVGDVLSRQDFKQRVKQYARERNNHYYFMALKTDEIIDATNKGNMSRFVNHSCDPNCETQKWTVNGELRIGFFAKRDIKAGEELTFDYQFQRYGREAQKCYCESEICTGFIGVSNQISVDVSSKSFSKRKKGTDEKRREEFEDLTLEEEIEKLCQNGGLRNKDETLILARLMVRAEDSHSRERLLDIILGTSEGRCLRLFLDYHGLSLLWSWMVDLIDTKLKAKILQVLQFLPVPNKTVLLESKVLCVIERWAENISHHIGNPQIVNSTSTLNTKKFKLCDTFDSENDNSMSQSSESSHTSRVVTEQSNTLNGSCQNVSRVAIVEEKCLKNSSDTEENTTIINDIRSGEESTDLEDKSSNFEIDSLVQNLLSSWKDLKEVFRIPRRDQHKQEDKAIDYTQKKKNFKQKELFNSKHSPFKFQFSKEYNRISRDLNKDILQDKNLDSYNCHNIDDKPRKFLLPTPLVLTKEERRLQFEREILESDQRKALQKQQEYIDMTQYTRTETVVNDESTSFYYDADTLTYSAVTQESVLYAGVEVNSVNYDQNYYNLDGSHSIRPALLPTPGSSTNLIDPLSTAIPENNVTIPPENIVYNSHPTQVSIVGTSYQTPNVNPCHNTFIPHSSNLIIGTFNSSPIVPIIQTLNTDTRMHGNPITDSEVHSSNQNTVSLPIHNFADAPIDQQYESQESLIEKQNRGYYYQAQYEPQTSEQVSIQMHYSLVNGTEKYETKPSAVQLPPNWKSATDSDGNIYYYHILTRQTQWHPPELNTNLEDADGDTPTFDEPKGFKKKETRSRRPQKKHSKKKSTTTAPADTSSSAITSDISKKIKELFRTKMSNFVVQILNPYHRDDCRIGRITSNEDFKHLARKLTHFVMAKEIKHCKNVEELDCNENVKSKARDFVYKYMSKYGPIYKKDFIEFPYY